MEKFNMNIENILEDEIQEPEMENLQLHKVEIPENSDQYWVDPARMEIEDAINQIKGEQPEPDIERPEEFDIEIIVDFRPKPTDPGM